MTGRLIEPFLHAYIQQFVHPLKLNIYQLLPPLLSYIDSQLDHLLFFFYDPRLAAPIGAPPPWGHDKNNCY